MQSFWPCLGFKIWKLFSAQYIPNQLFLKQQPTELLILYFVTNLSISKTKYMQLQMLCFIGLQKRPSRFSCFWALLSRFQVSLSCFQAPFSCFQASRFQALLSRIWAPLSELDFCSFELCTFKASRFWASLSRFLHFELHLIGSLHSFDLVLITPGPCFRNTCSISVISIQRVLKQINWQTYKDNGSGIKLRLQKL